MRRAFALAVAALALSQVAVSVRSRLADDLPGAWWIGHLAAARRGEGATVLFAARAPLDVPAAKATLRLAADRTYEAVFDGIRVGAGPGAGASALDEWTLAGPIAAGEHEIRVRVAHPEGAAALRLALVFAVAGGTREVVTGPRWRAEDDAERMKTGFGGARYPATLWARPALSVFSFSSSSTRSVRGSADVSSAPASSRIPSRAATE